MKKERLPVDAERWLKYIFDRRIAEVLSTPKWVDFGTIRGMHKIAIELSNSTGESYTLDHIIPLQHDLVSGLNVPWNLQLLTKSANSSKGARFDQEHQSVVQMSLSLQRLGLPKA